MSRLNSRFWDRIATKYAKSTIDEPEAYEKKLELSRRYMRPQMHVAEIGCGTGSTAIAHAPFVAHIDASDISNNMLQIARAKAADLNITNISFIHAKFEDMSPASATCDMVMAHSILHLVKNKDQVISQIYQMLKPGGFFISSTTCAAHNTIAKLLLPIGNFVGLLPLVNFFDEENLLSSMVEAKFSILEQFQPNEKSALFIVAQKPPDTA